jgi:hypothetical protein
VFTASGFTYYIKKERRIAVYHNCKLKVSGSILNNVLICLQRDGLIFNPTEIDLWTIHI